MSFPLKFVKKNYVSNTNQGKWRVCGDERTNAGILDKTLTSRAAAYSLTEAERDLTTAVCHRLDSDGCQRAVIVPSMLGLDDDVKSWPVYRALEHNCIVNRRITSQVHLATGNGPELDSDHDVKRDVMPSSDPGPEQLAEFERSIAEHFQKIAPLKKTAENKGGDASHFRTIRRS